MTASLVVAPRAAGTRHPVRRGFAIAAGLVVFIVLATANSGGYRYGVSDQAYYEPAIQRAIDPSLFPHDAPVLEAESRLFVADTLIGDAARWMHAGLPSLFFALYLLTLATLAASAIVLARALGFSWWATAALLLLLTLHHHIAGTGANALEGYFHPRELAFAAGVAALASLVARRPAVAAVALAATFLLHPTTGAWFSFLLVPAFALERLPWRRAAGLLAIGAAAVAVPAFIVFAPRLVVMDDAWLGVLTGKDYLFPASWPLYPWVLNLAYVAVIWLAIRARERRGLARAIEPPLGVGGLVLLSLFLVSVPFTAWHVALAVQLQVTRVFWILDFVATVYIAWWLTEGIRTPALARRAGPVAVAVLVLASAARGVFLLATASPPRPLVTLGLPDTPWVDALAWIGRQPGREVVLADPDHAWKYGVSVRVGARRDTVLESVKDAALALYDRSVAARVAERTQALGDFEVLSTAAVRGVGLRFGADLVIVPRARVLDLPLRYQNGGFSIYALR